MPHKRAKRSAREQQKKQSGSDIAPTSTAISKEPIPKSVARVLNAVKVQDEWRSKKRKLDTPGGDGTLSKKRKMVESMEDMKIQPGESLGHFNRRVEQSLRGTVRTAMQTSAAHVRKAKKDEEAEKAGSKQTKPTKIIPESPEDDAPSHNKLLDKQREERQRPTEFTSTKTSAPKRLNDIVQAPPELKKLPRGAKAKSSAASKDGGGRQGKSLKDGLLSMAQKAMMEEERERAVRLYREMKKKNAAA
ncbi:hypothetical protein BXZ70DRAFT_923276 [Cristinia sonorae]|uniref:Uncharacterized protein n=1 Tax=Cristinia sonorae TaxID=1940300 RepID=A0A8K0UUK2_9AGAR|nr:hypothetical protein BXZ70DRAFT_923276 [Cristinia sonorae]